LQLLTDPDEIRDVLEAYGEKAPESPAAAHQKLVDVLRGVSEEALLNVCFALAANFARMSQEILDLCGDFGITGQIQMSTAKLDVPTSGLDSSWAFALDPRFGPDADQRANSIAGAVETLARRLDPKRFINGKTERRETDLGRALRESPDPRHHVYRDVLDGAEEDVHYDVVRESDLRLVTSALEEIQTLRLQTPSPTPVAVAFDGLEKRGKALIDAMMNVKQIRGEPSPGTLALCDEILLLIAQARELAEETAAAERTQGGFRDFLRTDFWFQRWRIYELWVLTRVLRVLARVGGETQLLRSEGGIWRLQYGRDASPVASAAFPNGRVDIFYQLFEGAQEGADMPDIALRDVTGDYVAVIDPKHGKSYRRNKVDDILRRYAMHFRAGLTAMVNYYPMPDYDFSEHRIGARRSLLASDIAPGTVRLRRLEVNLEDLLLARNFAPRETIANRQQLAPKRPAPRSGVLVYYVDKAREVDEPAGVWSSSGLIPALAPWLDKETQVFAPAPGGRTCVVSRAAEWTLLRERKSPQKIDILTGIQLGSFERGGGWNPQGTKYAVCSDSVLKIISDSGAVVLSMPLSSDSGEDFTALGWTASGMSLLFEVRSQSSLTEVPGKLKRLDLRESSPLLFEYPVEVRSKSISLQMGEAFGIGNERGTFVRTAAGDRLILSADERQLAAQDADGEAEEFIAASPSGRYLITKGPYSLHHREGVRLLKILSPSDETELPLIRFFGDIQGQIRWSPDESRLAFNVFSREDRQHRLMVARIGDRHAVPVSEGGSLFGWLSEALVNWLGRNAEIGDPNCQSPG
jgi:hypothetical protein